MKTFAYEDNTFTSGESPRVHDVESFLGVQGRSFEIRNSGETSPVNGDLLFEVSPDGVNYGGSHTLKSGETLGIEKIGISKIRITWISDTSYQIFSS